MSAPHVKRTTQEPSAALRPFVQEFFVTESHSEWTRVLLPDTALVAGFRLNGTSIKNGTEAMPAAIIAGLQHSARTLTHSGGTCNVLVKFTEAGASAFLREPIDLLFDTTMSLDWLIQHSELDLIAEQLYEAKQHTDRILVLERFLLGRLRNHAPDHLAAAAAARIKEAAGCLRIKDLAREIGLSQSALERRFRKSIGTSPRKFASIVRLRHVIQCRAKGGNLTEIAHRVGYSDQSHFIKDFKRFTGLAPGAFFQQSSFC